MTRTHPFSMAPDRNGKPLLKQLIAELNRTVGAVDTAPLKGRIIVRSMVSEARKGDQRLQTAILTLLEKIEPLLHTPDDRRHAVAEWEALFAFFGKYKPLIEREIERRKAEYPSYWSFDWFAPTLEAAPWYETLYGDSSY